MVDGAAYLLAGIYGLYSQGSWADERGVNFVDSGAPWYDVYKTKDGKWLSVGAIEKRFYEELVEKLGLASARSCPSSTIARAGPCCGALRRGDRLARRATNGSASSQAATPASHRCWRFGEVESHPHNVARGNLRAARRRAAAGPRAALLPHRCEMGAPARGRGVDSEAVLRIGAMPPPRSPS
jgi:alpha-methylacyl-CoA racemase